MPSKRKEPSPERKAQLIAGLRRDKAEKVSGYRAKALKLYPHLCARCSRELSGKRLRELTVHHIDHDHNNNPTDGSNWELLCLYCHDNEHEKTLRNRGITTSSDKYEQSSSIFNQFEGLDTLITPNKNPDADKQTESES